MIPELCFHNRDVSPTSPQNIGFGYVGIEDRLLDPSPTILGHDRNKTRQGGCIVALGNISLHSNVATNLSNLSSTNAAPY